MTIRTKYRTGGEAKQRYVRKHICQDWYQWCEQGHDGYDVAQGTCDAEDLPPAIKATCDTYTSAHYACVWPLPHNVPINITVE